MENEKTNTDLNKKETEVLDKIIEKLLSVKKYLYLNLYLYNYELINYKI